MHRWIHVGGGPETSLRRIRGSKKGPGAAGKRALKPGRWRSVGLLDQVAFHRLNDDAGVLEEA